MNNTIDAVRIDSRVQCSTHLAALGKGVESQPPWAFVNPSEANVEKNEISTCGGEALDLSELERLHIHADATFHTRVNILLVAESIFLAALTQVWSSGGFFIQAALCVLGFITTAFIGGSLDELAKRTAWLATQRMRSTVYSHYVRSVPAPQVQTYRLANTLPSIFLLEWLVLFLALIARILFASLPTWLL